MSILRKSEVSQMVGLSTVTIWRLEKAGNFPSRVQLGPRCVGWKEEEIDQWIESRPTVVQEKGNKGK
jgi:prophage regulatory protein